MSAHQQAATQTVIQLAEHMTRLKTAAASFSESTAVRERGYFSPSEDDQVVHLWVSYHMARNALYEVVTKHQQAEAKNAGASLSDFVVAYAAATVLVDAGRFLRELFADEPIIRRKLNESYELFGIAANSFEAIQLSLSDPLHAIQLYQAREFYDQNLAALRDLANGNTQIKQVLNVIDQLAGCLRVSASSYAKARASDRAKQVVDRVVHKGIGQAIYAIQSCASEWIGQLSTRPSHRPALPDSVRSELLDLLEPGDVLVTRKEHSLTNYFLPGYWPHAALYIGNGRVVEALADGVHERSVDSPFAVDAIATIRPQVASEQIEQVIQRALTHVGKPYDFDFDFTRADRMVCTEVIYRSYEGIGDMQFQLTRRAARETLSAEDLLMLARNQQRFEHLALFCPDHCNELLRDHRIESVLAATMGT
ncbi:MAG: YiiX/YebB-like N1pC/P60 family cysteine hydrolase [Planctomycetota bacterium]